jgi:hypothetical protein
MDQEIAADPFGERTRRYRRSMYLLGARIQFESNNRELLDLVDSAYYGLPSHRLSAKVKDLKITLLQSPLQHAQHAQRAGEPAPLGLLQGSGLLGGATAASDFVVLSPAELAALVVTSPKMLRFPYHTRYEMIEFAVFALASRAQHLIPLHGACIGKSGRGILLLGPSGAGKSTVALHCLLEGLDFLSEDSVFVEPGTMLASGIANFLHVRADSLRRLGRSRAANAIRKSPVIQRRSGVRKYELDLRRQPFRLAPSPLRIVAVVFLSAQRAGPHPLLASMSKAELHAHLELTQAYGASQPQWRTFIKKMGRIPAYQMRRGRSPADAVTTLRSLLATS